MNERYLISYYNAKGLDLPNNTPVYVVINDKLITNNGVIKQEDKENLYYDVTDMIKERFEAEDKIVEKSEHLAEKRSMLDYITTVKVDNNQVTEIVSKAKIEKTEGRIMYLYPSSSAYENDLVKKYKDTKELGLLYDLEQLENGTYVIKDGSKYFDVSKAVKNPSFTEQYGDEIVELIGNKDNSYTLVNEQLKK